ncbi:hypothetical protein FF011L_16120 [Roseimaritima multifibrata]|uniref:Uncharacterized protein n=1 Tax=Roseimaritima multifibrata TaxID=1930274 RepID=A0A517MD97_9BACT|nr:hypothetical protein [Roseimaritima multifibrata]QDS92863.1 hypothetical protein FF011L_16120 [Roseimaritima multifibrata]
MWRSLFLAVGIMMIILGVECLLIDSAAVYKAGKASSAAFADSTMPQAAQIKIWQPAEWLPWGLLSGGTVVVLYAVNLPKRWGQSPAE